MPKIGVIGSNGQLGTDISRTFREAGWETINWTHQDFDVRDASVVADKIINSSANVVVNTAAFHKVDLCERDPELAFSVNSLGALNVARVCKSINAKNIFISSDYVFNGEKGDAYDEEDPTNPVNVYGVSKVAGESVVLLESPDNLVLRISSVFGIAGSSGKGGNFIETILSRAKNNEPLSVVDDILMSPTYTVDVATLLLRLLEQNFRGIVHGANAGRTTWHEFATSILSHAGMQYEVSRNKTNWEVRPTRPRNSSLTSSRLDNFGFIQPKWENALDRYLVQKGHLQ